MTIDLFSGNCGMYAIALGKKAQGEGKKVEMLVLTPKGDDPTSDLEGTVYHVGVMIDGKIYDGRGRISLKKFAGFAYAVFGDPSPRVHYFALNDALVRFFRQNTDWDTYWEDIEISKNWARRSRRGRTRKGVHRRTPASLKEVYA